MSKNSWSDFHRHWLSLRLFPDADYIGIGSYPESILLRLQVSLAESLQPSSASFYFV